MVIKKYKKEKRNPKEGKKTKKNLGYKRLKSRTNNNKTNKKIKKMITLIIKTRTEGKVKREILILRIINDLHLLFIDSIIHRNYII